jgi:hypothetical protein
VFCSAAKSQTLLLKDARKLEGKYAEIGSIAENPLSPKAQAGEVPVTPLLVIDDGLRRTFIHSFQGKDTQPPAAAKDVRINIWQPVAAAGRGRRATGHREPPRQRRRSDRFRAALR